jgi:drug/metabolite transporter (DMT)-like permease
VSEAEGESRADQPAPPPASRPVIGFALIALLALVWGSNWPAIRVAVLEIPPWTFRTICLAVGSATLFAVLIARRRPLRVPRREIVPLIFVGLANVTAWHMLTAYGLTMTEASRGVLLAFTFPLWSLLFGAMMLGEKLTAARILALVLGLGAVALLMGPAIAGVGQSPLGGVLLVGAAISWALATMAFKKVRWTIGSGELAAWQLLIGGIPVFIVTGFVGDAPDFSKVTLPAWIGLIYGSIIAVSFGQWIWFRLLAIMPAGVAAISSLAIPIVGVFSSALLIGEQLGWRELAALALVSAALAIVLVGRDGWRALQRIMGKA